MAIPPCEGIKTAFLSFPAGPAKIGRSTEFSARACYAGTFAVPRIRDSLPTYAGFWPAVHTRIGFAPHTQ